MAKTVLGISNAESPAIAKAIAASVTDL